MDVITKEDHALMAKVTPELDGIKSYDDWWLGWFALNKSVGCSPKTWPMFRKGGYNHPLNDPEMRFRVDSFRAESGEAAAGIVLVQPKENKEVWVGWVRGARASEAAGWVQFLNDELGKLWAAWVAINGTAIRRGG